ncbi:site-specific integrase [Vagococcus xieshaowenii]|uniref:Site-specific integrase n=1 Tax=Vagococcus xieshaowenii TaxID=2562451 RepID=A0AAJ5JLR9_9ENTE|nr:site-specific integrase [Vagococcus xieshaowenii]QCA28901.1 site-specific integrase [Vagococcus xieshaowenii]TFZ43319.1 site-specific integrase [Vagococcus xieshaowenii]
MATFKQYSKKDGSKAWLFQAYLGVDSATGKEVRTTRRGFKTKKQAQLEVNRLVVEFEEKGLVKQSENTFKEMYLLWYESYKTTVKETTSITTERLMTKHALPVFGNLRINKIDVKLAQKTVNDWAKKMKTYKIILQYCSKVMEYAINLELAQHNPFSKVIRPNIKDDSNEKKIKFYNLEEVHQVMKFLDDKVRHTQQGTLIQKFFAEYDQALYRLMAFSGLRGGEASALTFDDIDFTNKTVTVNKTLSEVRGGYAVSTPKTKSSYRTISLDDKTIMILKRWQLRQRELLFANRGKKSNYVFVNIEGELMNRTDLYQRSKRLSKAVGLHNIGTHGWRHTHASMLFEAGVTMKEAQERLGHSSITQTMDTYTHLGNKAQERTVDKLTQIANF